MSAIRVCTVTFDPYPFEPRVLRLVRAALDAGYEVDVICLHRPGEKARAVVEGASVYRMPMYRGYGVPLFLTVLSWCWFLLLAGGTVTWLHLRRAYDVIHVHNMPDFLVFSAFVPRLLGVKVILDVQDISPELMSAKATKPQKRLVTFLATWQEGLSAAFADSVVTVGWPFEEQLLKRGVPREKLTVILNSADPKQFPPSRLCYEDTETGESARPFIVMYHGTLAKRNGLDVAMRAFALACRDVDGLRLDIQGRGEQLPMLKQLAVELGVQDRVIFTDYCPPEKMVDFVVHGDVGIIPYPCDGFMELVLPTKAYEYAWMRRPIIASNTDAIRSMFRPESIVLCEPSSPESFAEAIIDLYRSPEKRASLVTNAAEDYMLYRWELMSMRYQQLLESLSCRPTQEQEQEQPSVLSHDM